MPPAPSPGRLPDPTPAIHAPVHPVPLHIALTEPLRNHVLADEGAPRPMTLAMLLEALAQQTASHGSRDSAAEPVVQSFAAPDTTTQQTELSVALATGLAASVGLLVWAGRGSALLTSLLISTPAWRGYDLLPVLREREENRDWGPDDAAADTSEAVDDDDDDNASLPAADRPQHASSPR